MRSHQKRKKGSAISHEPAKIFLMQSKLPKQGNQRQAHNPGGHFEFSSFNYGTLKLPDQLASGAIKSQFDGNHIR